MRCATTGCPALGQPVFDGDQGIQGDTGFSYCLLCGQVLATRTTTLVSLPSPDGKSPCWLASWTRDEGKWSRKDDGAQTWAIQIWMPDNTHREGVPMPGDEAQITTSKGKVSIVVLGKRLGGTRQGHIFQAPPAKKTPPRGTRR